MNDDALKKGTLKNRFLSLWKECLKPGTNTNPEAIWNDLVRRYSEPGRHYHTLNHLRNCIGQMDLALAYTDDPKALEMGILFHDVICEPNARDNEQRSADFFAQTAGDNFNQDFIIRVKQLILSTVHDRVPPSNDEKLICDIDLTSFAIPWARFRQDSDAVRAECPSTPDQQYYPGKLKFLKMLLERPAIFFTEFFYERCEKQARENIRQYCIHLNEEMENLSRENLIASTIDS